MPFRDPFYQATTCLHQCLTCFRAADWLSAVDWVNDVDWYEELRLVTTSVLLTSVVWLAAILFSYKYPDFSWDLLFHRIRRSDRIKLPDWIRLPRSTSGTVKPPRTMICRAARSYHDSKSTRRTEISSENVHIYAWPSKGGVIILDHAERVDLDFLRLNPFDLPAERLADQKDEDDFCQRLLLLGAKWWDSEARKSFVDDDDDMNEGAFPIPTLRERQWVSVAWPSTGGLWVAEFDSTIWGIIDDILVPSNIAMLRLAHTMDERSQVLRDHFSAKFYEDLKSYNGHTFLKSWGDKETGEVGSLSLPVKLGTATTRGAA